MKKELFIRIIFITGAFAVSVYNLTMLLMEILNVDISKKILNKMQN